MIILNINCFNELQRNEVRDSFCSALKGSPAFISSEIMVSDDPERDNVFALIVGNGNDSNIKYDVDFSDLNMTLIS